MPRFSPDGTQVVYAVATRIEPNNNDIFITRADGGGSPTFLMRSPANELYPVVSHDGQFLAFSSDSNGNWDIYIMNINTQELFQLTNSPGEEDYPGDWWQAS
jgi:Tol biopolymer transport system component